VKDAESRHLPAPQTYPVALFRDKEEWTSWLDSHHATAAGVWLRIAKKGSALVSVSISEALDAALCYGWIDGQRNSLDADSYLQKFTPRRKRSVWSKINRENVARLIRSGAMRPAGMAAVEAAKADGRWERAYDSPGSSNVPADLETALQASPQAKAFFETLKSNNRYAILYRVQTAVKPETRARRIREFIDMLERGETLYPR
jgi:uncharacterized protein YdeI (YjbR/CyaY-like superfamily)